MKYQALFYQKNNEKYPRLLSAAVVLGALRVNGSKEYETSRMFKSTKHKERIDTFSSLCLSSILNG